LIYPTERVRIFIVFELEVLTQYGDPDKIGSPINIDQAILESAQGQKQQPTGISGTNFYGNRPQQQSTPQPQPQQRAAPSHSAHANLYPIEAITPYAHRWTIKARCTNKSDIKTWHNRQGEGKLFSVNLLDDSGEIRATGFNDQCDALYDLFQEGSVYYIQSPCQVRLAKKQFSNVNNDYELTFEAQTVVEKAEDEVNVPQVRFNFTSIGSLEEIEKDTTIDTIGILKEIAEKSEITSKTTAKPYSKRDLTLVDDSLRSVRLTVWGKTADNFDAPLESVIAFKGVKVSDFGGRSLSLLSSGSMTVDPDVDEAHKLKGWYDAQGRSDHFTSHAQAMGSSSGGSRQEYKTIAQVQSENIGMHTETAEYFNMKATVIYVKHDNFAYPACSTEGCNKKVVEVEQGEWRCERCNKSYPSPNYRYIMSCNVSDHTGQMWLSCFDDSARVIMGMDANALTEARNDDEARATELFNDATCKTYNFRVRAKMDSFNDQQR
jgi:replication factor A1